MRQSGGSQLILPPSIRFACYPNPVTSGAAINLSIPKTLAGTNQVLQITEMAAGRLVYSKPFTGDARRFSVSNRLAAGSYVIRLVGNASGTPLKLIVIK